ncbi:MAG: ABC transporter permease [Actinobacteria bacterium]|nr:ABC transporter permease [Actinomycetota bacterium]
MFLAFREIRRAKTRFALLIGAVAMLVFLILFQYTIQNSLVRAFVGGVDNQNAEVLVFNVDGRRTTQSSTVSPDLRALVENSDGVAETGSIWASTFTMDTGDKTEAVSVLSFDNADVGAPELVDGSWPQAPGEVVANDSDATRGFDVGATVTVVPGEVDLTVVGLVKDAGINVVPTVYTTPDTYLSVLQTRLPDAVMPPANVVAVRPESGTDAAALATRLNEASGDIDALTRRDASQKNPGVASIKQSFNVIFVLFALVVPLVTGLFFLILTFQKAESLTLLRALGIPARELVKGLLTQVVFVLFFGIAAGVALYYPISQVRLSSVALRFETTATIVWCALLAALGLISALASIRRVLQIDPIAATTGAGVR